MSLLLTALCGLHLIAALPTEPTPYLTDSSPVVAPQPTGTSGAHGVVLQRKDVIDDITSKVDGYINSILTELGSGIPSYVTEGLLPNMQGLPTGDEVMSSAGVQSSDLDAVPTQVLNIPAYANWTNNGWNLRIRGNVYKQPEIPEDKINDLTNVFLIDTSVEELPASQAEQARNLTRGIFVVQQGEQNVTMNLVHGPQSARNGTSGNAGEYTVRLPYETTPQGDFDTFVPIPNISSSLLPGDGERPPQPINVFAQGTDTGNATSYLVSDQGLTIISDIDDILRVTKIYEPKEGLLNSFARPFTPWMNMPDIYRNWSQSLPNLHFHYLTTTPEQITRNYMEFIYNTYPGGTFDTRPLNFSDVSATLSIRKYLLDRIFLTYPNRKFILVADTSNSDVMKGYPQMALDYPGQVQCIFLRNTSATDTGDKFPYNTDVFKNLNTNKYMFFHVPEDLTGLDIVNGQCVNQTIPQNVTFGYQGLPFGIDDQGDGNGGSTISTGLWLPAVIFAAALTILEIF